MNNYGNEYNSVTYSENFAERFTEVPWSTGTHSADSKRAPGTERALPVLLLNKSLKEPGRHIQAGISSPTALCVSRHLDPRCFFCSKR